MGDGAGSHVGEKSPTVTTLTSIYFFSHYMFASLTEHTTAMLPVILAVGISVITPYATGPGLAYYESGNLPAKDFSGG